MKLFILLIFIGLASCAPIHKVTPVAKMSFEVGVERISSVGNNMILVELCVDVHEERWAGLLRGGYASRDFRECGERQELIYNGISKNTIRITYREYRNDLARSSFFQDLTYDLDESDTIQFRSTKIKVLEANNSFIKFVVLEGPKTRPNLKIERVD